MNRSCVIGCAVVLGILAILVGVVMTKGPEWFKKGKSLVMGIVAEEQRIAAFEAAWTPPSPKPDERWTPPAVGDWKLQAAEAVPGWPELKIERAGHRAIYESGARSIEIGMVAANDLEKETLISRIKGAVTTGNGSNSTTTMGQRTHLTVNGTEHTRLWWLKDWLFIFRAKDDADSETFPEEYLKAIVPQ